VLGLKGPLSCLTQARYGIAWGVIGAAQACLAQLLDTPRTASSLAAPSPTTSRTDSPGRDGPADHRRPTARPAARAPEEAGTLTPAQVSLAKWNNCRIALDIARDARDLLGGSGISAEYVPIRHMLNLESVITYEGTETIHQLTIGRELTGVNAF